MTRSFAVKRPRMEPRHGAAPAQSPFHVFTEGDDLYDDMLAAIAQARRDIRLESYIFERDAVGATFIEALCARAREGVRVRLHLDALGSLALMLGSAPRQLREAGVELRWFNPPRPLRLFRLNRRNHRKLLVVDDQWAWLGGFNIHVESSRRHYGIERWRDTHVRFEGRLAALASDYFDRLWDGRRRWRQPFRGNTRAFLVSNHNLRQVHRFRRLLKRQMRLAQASVWLTTPYFMPDRGTRKGMADAARRGVDVRLLVPFKTDQVVTRWAARAAYSRLLAAGVRIYEYQPRMLHAKTVLIDDLWNTIGTANLNYRSFYVNFELNLITRDRDLAAGLRRDFLADLDHARPILSETWQRRGLWGRLAEVLGRIARKLL